MDEQEKQNLISDLQNGNDRQRRAASYKLSKSKDPSVVTVLINAYNDSDSSVRQNVSDGLRNIDSKDALDFLTRNHIATAKPSSPATKAPTAQASVTQAEGKRNMMFGALWFIGGIVVTLGTYSAASQQGGTYYVTWGAIIFGGIQFLKGLNQYQNAPQDGETSAGVMDANQSNVLEKYTQKISQENLDKPAEEYFKHGMEFMEKLEFDDAILEFVKVIRKSSPQEDLYLSAKKQLQGMGFSEADIGIFDNPTA